MYSSRNRSGKLLLEDLRRDEHIDGVKLTPVANAGNSPSASWYWRIAQRTDEGECNYGAGKLGFIVSMRQEWMRPWNRYSIDIKCTTQARQPRCGCIMRLEHGAVKLTIRDVTSESKSEIEANAQKWWMRRRRSYGVQLVCVDRSTS